jgi:hypothetical protein
MTVAWTTVAAPATGAVLGGLVEPGLFVLVVVVHLISP